MKMKVFSVYDCKVGAYLMPHFFRSRGEALRAYLNACSDKNSQFSSSPADYTFFEIGDYDDCDGIISMYDAKISLGTAAELISSSIA
nr:MAG: nonstructural protein [Microvirus sp.]